MQVIITGLTKPVPYLIRGNPVLFWIPDFERMAPFAAITLVPYNLLSDFSFASNLTPPTSDYLELYS